MNRITPLFVTLVLLVSAVAPVAAVEMRGGDFGICMVGVPSACNGDDTNEVTDRLDRMLGDKGIQTPGSSPSGPTPDDTTTTTQDGTTTTVTESSDGTTTTVTTTTQKVTETSTYTSVSTRTTTTSTSGPAAGDASGDGDADADGVDDADESQSLLDRVTTMPDGLSGAEKLDCLRNGCSSSSEDSSGSSTSTQTQTQTQTQSQTSP